jgi:ligand-binding sensor domain-containing protein
MTDGLSDDEVQGILQDRQGFLWIHSGSGLNKFDGYVFENYLNNPTSSYILSRRATIFHQDKKGRFWILTNEGISVFNPLTEKNDFLFPRNSFKGPIIRFRERKDGKLWICTNTHIYLIDGDTFSVERLAGLPSNLRYSDILQTHDGTLWENSTGGIIEIDTVSNRKEIHKPSFAGACRG